MKHLLPITACLVLAVALLGLLHKWAKYEGRRAYAAQDYAQRMTDCEQRYAHYRCVIELDAFSPEAIR